MFGLAPHRIHGLYGNMGISVYLFESVVRFIVYQQHHINIALLRYLHQFSHKILSPAPFRDLEAASQGLAGLTESW